MSYPSWTAGSSRASPGSSRLAVPVRRTSMPAPTPISTRTRCTPSAAAAPWALIGSGGWPARSAPLRPSAPGVHPDAGHRRFQAARTTRETRAARTSPTSTPPGTKTSTFVPVLSCEQASHLTCTPARRGRGTPLRRPPSTRSPGWSAVAVHPSERMNRTGGSRWSGRDHSMGGIHSQTLTATPVTHPSPAPSGTTDAEAERLSSRPTLAVTSLRGTRGGIRCKSGTDPQP